MPETVPMILSDVRDPRLITIHRGGSLTDVVDTGDVNAHVLSDLVSGNVADGVLNDSPIAQDLLHDGINDSLNDLVSHLL